MYSALKYQGKKLYEYARQGIDVPREARPITVYELLFIRHEGDELELESTARKAPIFGRLSMIWVRSWAAART
jgi:tRNA U55 pseudouridine synthase TruB